MKGITTQEQLDALPEGSIIRCEIEEYDGVFELTNTSGCCGGWHDFEVMDDGTVEIVDDYTPVLPAEHVQRKDRPPRFCGVKKP